MNKIHVIDTRIKCYYCGDRFASKTNLYDHLEHVHKQFVRKSHDINSYQNHWHNDYLNPRDNYNSNYYHSSYRSGPGRYIPAKDHRYQQYGLRNNMGESRFNYWSNELPYTPLNNRFEPLSDWGNGRRGSGV